MRRLLSEELERFPDRYSTENIRKAIRNPRLLGDEIERAARGVLKLPHLTAGRYQFRRRYGTGTDIMGADWDYLIILDACRHDILEASGHFGSEIGWTVSKGSRTQEFYRVNFTGRECFDTVCVTAVGWPVRVDREGVFHDVVLTHSNGDTTDDTEISPEWHGFKPTTVRDAALRAYEKYPDKRIIVHFMQPHAPYLGPRADELRSELERKGVRILFKDKFEDDPGGLADTEGPSATEIFENLLYAAQDGHVSLSELREVYIENLEIVIEQVDTLLEQMDGKRVVTSDHGELLGDRTGLWKYAHPRRYGRTGVPFGHPNQVYVEELRKVPWVVFDSETRPRITSEPPREKEDPDEDGVNRRLRALGYKTE